MPQLESINVCVISSAKDRPALERMTKHLDSLPCEGAICLTTFDQDRSPLSGRHAVIANLQDAHVIVILVSPDLYSSQATMTALELGQDIKRLTVAVHLRQYVSNAQVRNIRHHLPRDRGPIAQWVRPGPAWRGVVEDLQELISTELLGQAPTNPRPEYSGNPEEVQRGEQLNQLITTLRTGRGDRQAIVAKIRRMGTEFEEPAPGFVLGDPPCYQLLRRIGSGGFSEVWQASDLETSDIVAVKFLKPEYNDDQSGIFERFKRGAETMTRLRHSSIVRVVDGPDFDQGRHYFAMPFLDLGDLERALSEERIPRSRAILAVLDVADALQYANGLNPPVYHLDVKPSNILLRGDGTAQLCDFDLVGTRRQQTLTRNVGRPFTQLYAAPEQRSHFQESRSAVDDDVDRFAKADQYSLALTFSACWLGGSKDDGSSFLQQLQTQMTMPLGVLNVIRKATSPSPDDRYRDISAFRDALLNDRDLLTELAQEARKYNLLETELEFRRRLGRLTRTSSAIDHLLRAAEVAEHLGESTQVKEVLEKILEINSQDETPAAKVADFAERLAQFDLAVRALEQAIAYSTEPFGHLLKLAKLHSQRGSTKPALRAWQKISDLNPGHTDALQMLVTLGVEEQEWRTVLRAGKTLISQSSDAALRPLLAQLGKAAEAAGDLSIAKRYLRRACEDDTAPSDELEALARVAVADGDLTTAIRSYRRLMARRKDIRQGWTALRLARHILRDRSLADEIAASILDSDPRDLTALSYRVGRAKEAGRLSDVVTALERIDLGQGARPQWLRSRDDFSRYRSVFLEYVRALLSLERPDDAAAEVEWMVRFVEEPPAPLLRIYSQLLINRDNLALAENALHRLALHLEVDGYDSDVPSPITPSSICLELTRVRLALGRPRAAIDAAWEALDADPTSNDGRWLLTLSEWAAANSDWESIRQRLQAFQRAGVSSTPYHLLASIACETFSSAVELRDLIDGVATTGLTEHMPAWASIRVDWLRLYGAALSELDRLAVAYLTPEIREALVELVAERAGSAAIPLMLGELASGPNTSIGSVRPSSDAANQNPHPPPATPAPSIWQSPVVVRPAHGPLTPDHVRRFEARISALRAPPSDLICPLADHDHHTVTYKYNGSGVLLNDLLELCWSRKRPFGARATLELAVKLAEAVNEIKKSPDLRELGVAANFTPSRILVSHDGQIRVVGLGLPKPARAYPGTRFSSPQGCRNETATPESALYVVMLCIAELLTGSPVYGGAPESVRYQARHARPWIQFFDSLDSRPDFNSFLADHLHPDPILRQNLRAAPGAFESFAEREHGPPLSEALSLAALQYEERQDTASISPTQFTVQTVEAATTELQSLQARLDLATRELQQSADQVEQGIESLLKQYRMLQRRLLGSRSRASNAAQNSLEQLLGASQKASTTLQKFKAARRHQRASSIFGKWADRAPGAPPYELDSHGGHPALLVDRGTRYERVWLLSGTTRIGRVPPSEVCINRPSLAPIHATLSCEGVEWTISASDHAYPLAIDDTPTTGARLLDGDRIQLGHTTFYLAHLRV